VHGCERGGDRVGERGETFGEFSNGFHLPRVAERFENTRDPLLRGKAHPREGEWGTQLIKTPASQTWSIEETLLSDVESTIHVKGKTGSYPVDGDVYWIEGEAVEVALDSTTVSGATLTLVRGVCGSIATRHRLDPLRYRTPSGLDDKLILDSRPDFAAHTFTAQLYLFRLDQYGAVTASYLSRYCYVEGAPSPQKGRVWEIRLRDIGELLAKHKIGAKERTVSLSRRIMINSFAYDQYADTGYGVAKEITAHCTRLEGELLTREPLHRANLGVLNESMTDDLSALYNTTADDLLWYLEVEASGKWLFEITSMAYDTPIAGYAASGGDTGFLAVRGTLVDREPTAAVFEPGVAQVAGSLTLTDGWSVDPASPVGYQKQGEVAPKITLRAVIIAPPIAAFLLLCCNDDGSLPGRIGPELPLSWFQVGSAAGSVALIDPGTVDLAKRAQLLTANYHYALQMSSERTVGDYLAGDLCLFRVAHLSITQDLSGTLDQDSERFAVVFVERREGTLNHVVQDLAALLSSCFSFFGCSHVVVSFLSSYWSLLWSRRFVSRSVISLSSARTRVVGNPAPLALWIAT